MNTLNYYYLKILRRDLSIKFLYKNLYELPRLKKILLSFAVSQSSLKNVLPLLSALQLLSYQPPCLTLSKKQKIKVKFKNGVAIACKVDLRKKEMYLFLERFIFLILPRLKHLSFTFYYKTVNLKLENSFLFREIEKEYEYLQDLPFLNMHLVFEAKSNKEICYLLKTLKIPFFKDD